MLPIVELAEKPTHIETPLYLYEPADGRSPQLGSARGNPSHVESPQPGYARGHPSHIKSPAMRAERDAVIARIVAKTPMRRGRRE